MIKILGIVTALSLTANSLMYFSLRSAQARADRAVAECNQAQVQTELDFANARLAATAESLRLEREAAARLAEGVDSIRAELIEETGRLETNLERSNAQLRAARQRSTDSCLNKPFDRSQWLRFRNEALAPNPDSDPASGETSAGEGTGGVLGTVPTLQPAA